MSNSIRGFMVAIKIYENHPPANNTFGPIEVILVKGIIPFKAGKRKDFQLQINFLG